jgi:hypothetical protein
MTAPMETQIAIELEANARKLHKQAQAVEERWRTAHGFDTKLRGKHQVEAKRKWRPLERGEVRRREERKRQRVERQMLARPLLKGVEGSCRERPHPTWRLNHRIPRKCSAPSGTQREVQGGRLGACGTHHGEYSALMRRQFGTEFETGGDPANQERKPCRSN